MIHTRSLLLAGRPGKRTSIVSHVPGDDHPNTLVSIHNMGGLLRDAGRLEEEGTKEEEPPSQAGTQQGKAQDSGGE